MQFKKKNAGDGQNVNCYLIFNEKITIICDRIWLYAS